MKFHEKLSKLIELRGFTKAKVARDADITHSTLSSMCRGERRPYMDQAAKLAKALSVSLDYLANDDLPWPPPSRTESIFEEIDVRLNPELIIRPDITDRALKKRLEQTQKDLEILHMHIREFMRSNYESDT